MRALTLVTDLHTTGQKQPPGPSSGEKIALREDGMAAKKSKKTGSKSKLKKVPLKPVTNLSLTKRNWIDI